MWADFITSLSFVVAIVHFSFITNFLKLTLDLRPDDSDPSAQPGVFVSTMNERSVIPFWLGWVGNVITALSHALKK